MRHEKAAPTLMTCSTKYVKLHMLVSGRIDNGDQNVVIVVEYDIVQIFVRFIVMVYRFKAEYS